MTLFLQIFLPSLLIFSIGISFTPINGEPTQRNLVDFDPSCPLNFRGLLNIEKPGCCNFDGFITVSTECYFLMQTLLVVRSDYLRTTGHFMLPHNSSEACWKTFQSVVNSRIGPFNVRSNCSVPTSWISNDCKKVSTRLDFEAVIPDPDLQKVRLLCNKSLGDGSACERCLSILSDIQGTYFNGAEAGGTTDCAGYASMYTAAFVNQFGPFDYGTIKCLFSVDMYPRGTSTVKHGIKIIWGVLGGCAVVFLGTVCAVIWFLRVKGLKHLVKKGGDSAKAASVPNIRLEFLGENPGLVKYTFEEMKEVTRNFSRANLIGTGGYGNVYKGTLLNGCEVALKRFKNCSAFGSANFAHEIEVIASIRHINLVTLRGYCIAIDAMGNHQRIIVCDLMHNGSLHDHLFGSKSTNRLPWPIRKKIAIGTARGLAYLHKGAQTIIIHRDVKTSNILLDEEFEPKLADFGLAKFTPDGFSHLSTKVAGTLGYVAPEYALYGQLTERSDVYSFGVVLLQLLNGKEAVISIKNGEALLLVDWAWSMVREGQASGVIEDDMVGMERLDMMERYVLVAVLSAHPLLHARPTMEQIVNMLESAQVDTGTFQRLDSDLRSVHMQSSNSKSGCSSLDRHRAKNSYLSCSASQLDAPSYATF
ncbi:Non-specific serine/threonine protein kinase [Bertholletia excelsa]